jgi:hypothetical protein
MKAIGEANPDLGVEKMTDTLLMQGMKADKH